MNVLSLFSGIGGLDLGLERAGMTIAGQVEIDPWCRKILAKHWPEVPRHDDVRTCAEWWLSLANADGIPEPEKPEGHDVIEAGRPVQPARTGTGHRTSDGNHPAGNARPAADARRSPVDVVCGGFPCQPVSLAGKRLAQADSRWLWPAFHHVIRDLRPRYVLVENVPGLLAHGMADVLGDLAAIGYDAEWDSVPAAFIGAPHIRNRVFIVAYPNSEPVRMRAGDLKPLVWPPIPRHQRPAWPAEPGVGRVAHGVPHRVDRLRGLGNAVVPQVAEHIGKLIMEAAA